MSKWDKTCRRSQTERRIRNKTVADAYKAYVGCKDCGEKDPIVLDFDHLGHAPKLFSIARAVGAGRNLQLIIDEIAKCEVVCSNCHRRRTHARRKGIH